MLKVLKSGFFTSLQDSGRLGYRNKGVPVSGCMDQLAQQQCNSLLQNTKGSAVLEITMVGPRLRFNAHTFITITGADLSPLLNGAQIQNYLVHAIVPGDVLSFGKLKKGFRAYLGVKGGFLATKILGSASQYLPVTPAATLGDGEELQYNLNTDFTPLISEMRPENYMDNDILNVHPGPEFGLLVDEQKTRLFESFFSVAKENNRMAYQLTEILPTQTQGILTSATLPGTVQLTPAGKLIVLMRDGQTTGGYPRILQLTQDAICLLAQKKTGDRLRFGHIP